MSKKRNGRRQKVNLTTC